MSLESWKKEFYPVTVEHIPKEKAGESVILKWDGLKKENLEKHDIDKYDVYISDCDNEMTIDLDNCAWCYYYMSLNCVDCLGYQANNQRCNQVYDKWADENNIFPMIEWIEKGVKWEKERNKEK